MTLPALENWESTRTGLQRAAQALGAVCAALRPPQPKHLHLSLYPVRRGLSTGPLPVGGELLLDFAARAVFYARPAIPHFEIPVHGFSQESLAARIVRAFEHAGHTLELDQQKVADTEPLAIDAGLAAGYAAALDTIHTAAARFRGRLYGPQTPLVVWPHGFDLSTLWFTRAGSDESSDPHMAFGFSPGSAGFARPYLYVYGWPTPSDLGRVTLPPLARVHTDGWTGVVVDYDALVGLDSPVDVIENLYGDIHRALQPLMA